MADNKDFFDKDGPFGKEMKDLETSKPSPSSQIKDNNAFKPTKAIDPSSSNVPPSSLKKGELPSNTEIFSIGKNTKLIKEDDKLVKKFKAAIDQDFKQVINLVKKQNAAISAQANNISLVNKDLQNLKRTIDTINRQVAAVKKTSDEIKNKQSSFEKFKEKMESTWKRGDIYKGYRDAKDFSSSWKGSLGLGLGAAAVIGGIGVSSYNMYKNYLNKNNPEYTPEKNSANIFGEWGWDKLMNGPKGPGSGLKQPRTDRAWGAGVKSGDSQDEIERKFRNEYHQRREMINEHHREENRKARDMVPGKAPLPGMMKLGAGGIRPPQNMPGMSSPMYGSHGMRHPNVSWDTHYQRAKIDELKGEFLKFGHLPTGFEFSPGHMGTLGNPGAVAARGAMPLAGLSSIPRGFGAPSYNRGSASIGNLGSPPPLSGPSSTPSRPSSTPAPGSTPGSTPAPGSGPATTGISGPLKDEKGYNKRLAEMRESLFKELDGNPQLKRDVIKTLSMENGGSPEKLADVLESMVNRMAMRGYKSFHKAIHDGFYGPVNRGGLRGGLSSKHAEWGEKAIGMVRAGRNNIEYRTDQGMLTDPGARRYMREPDKSGHRKINGENYFWMGKPGRKFATDQAKADEEYQRKLNEGASTGPGASAAPSNPSAAPPPEIIRVRPMPLIGSGPEKPPAAKGEFRNINGEMLWRNPGEPDIKPTDGEKPSESAKPPVKGELKWDPPSKLGGPDVKSRVFPGFVREQFKNEEEKPAGESSRKFLVLPGSGGTYGNDKKAFEDIARKHGASPVYLDGNPGLSNPNSPQILKAIEMIKQHKGDISGIVGFSAGAYNLRHILNHPEFKGMPQAWQDNIKKAIGIGAPGMSSNGRIEAHGNFGGGHLDAVRAYADKFAGSDPASATKPSTTGSYESGFVDKTKQLGFGSRWGTFKEGEVKGLIMHHTGPHKNDDAVINTFKGRGVATQYILNRDGTITRTLPEGAKGGHMRNSKSISSDGKNYSTEFGRSLSIDYTNKNTEGIEVIAKDNKDWTPEQKEAAKMFMVWHSRKFGYDASKNIFGHGELNRHKQSDEGLSSGIRELRSDPAAWKKLNDEYDKKFGKGVHKEFPGAPPPGAAPGAPPPPSTVAPPSTANTANYYAGQGRTAPQYGSYKLKNNGPEALSEMQASEGLNSMFPGGKNSVINPLASRRGMTPDWSNPEDYPGITLSPGAQNFRKSQNIGLGANIFQPPGYGITPPDQMAMLGGQSGMYGQFDAVREGLLDPFARWRPQLNPKVMDGSNPNGDPMPFWNPQRFQGQWGPKNSVIPSPDMFNSMNKGLLTTDPSKVPPATTPEGVGRFAQPKLPSWGNDPVSGVPASPFETFKPSPPSPFPDPNPEGPSGFSPTAPPESPLGGGPPSASPAPEAPAAPAAPEGEAPAKAPSDPASPPRAGGPPAGNEGGNDGFPQNQPETAPESPGSSGMGSQGRCYV